MPAPPPLHHPRPWPLPSHSLHPCRSPLPSPPLHSQDKLLYYPAIPGVPYKLTTDNPPPFNSPAGWGLSHEEVTLVSGDGTRLHGWFVRAVTSATQPPAAAAGDDAAGRGGGNGGKASAVTPPTIVFFHANAGAWRVGCGVEWSGVGGAGCGDM